MTVPTIAITNQGGKSPVALRALLAFFVVGVVLPNFPRVFPRPVMAAAQAVPAVLFALIHGANLYRVRGILGFAAISLVFGYIAEVLGVHTGFPFGHYYFTDGMGPKFLEVPILMGPAYVGMGYISWTVTRVIAAPRDLQRELVGLRMITLPLAASFVMVAWGIAIDPVLSTFAHYWTWTRGGAFFGVPLSNFLGWYATNYLIYQFFVLFLRKGPAISNFLPTLQDRLAVLFYAVCAAGIVLRGIYAPASSVVADPSGAMWRVADINAASCLAAIFIMGAFVAMALVRLAGPDPELSTRGEDRDRGARPGFSPQDEAELAK
jgi:uncharacterized membrane protein